MVSGWGIAVRGSVEMDVERRTRCGAAVDSTVACSTALCTKVQAHHLWIRELERSEHMAGGFGLTGCLQAVWSSLLGGVTELWSTPSRSDVSCRLVSLPRWFPVQQDVKA